MSIRTLDLRDLAKELAELREREKPGLNEEETERLAALESLESDLTGGDLATFADNEPTLIAEDSFTEYAEELAEDIGALKDARDWPCNCIDWERAASELMADYSSVEFDGETWLYRS